MRHKRRRRWVLLVIALTVLAVPLLIGSLVGAIYWQARTDEAMQSDAIVVLGAAQYNGRPSEVLEARLLRTLELYESGYAPLIVVTGGKIEGDVYTEAEASRNFLVAQGVPVSAIVLEDQSRDTWASLRGVKTVLGDRDVESLLIVSDGFHLFRAELMARE
ncbi:MAG: YdcF family protein, partial [Thermomicrobiales bacterium]